MQAAMVAALNVKGIPLAPPPAYQTRRRRSARWNTLAGTGCIVDRLNLAQRQSAIVNGDFIELARERRGSINTHANALSRHHVRSVADPADSSTQSIGGDVRNSINIKCEVRSPPHKRHMMEQAVI